MEQEFVSHKVFPSPKTRRQRSGDWGSSSCLTNYKVNRIIVTDRHELQGSTRFAHSTLEANAEPGSLDDLITPDPKTSISTRHSSSLQTPNTTNLMADNTFQSMFPSSKLRYTITHTNRNNMATSDLRVDIDSVRTKTQTQYQVSLPLGVETSSETRYH